MSILKRTNLQIVFDMNLQEWSTPRHPIFYELAIGFQAESLLPLFFSPYSIFVYTMMKSWILYNVHVLVGLSLWPPLWGHKILDLRSLQVAIKLIVNNGTLGFVLNMLRFCNSENGRNIYCRLSNLNWRLNFSH